MLRALKPFFELVVYTDKGKEESEAIINEIEKGFCIFSYIIPINYCYYIQSDQVFAKDMNVFFGTRIEGEVAMISTKAFDGLLHPCNVVPVLPFLGDVNDRILIFLEVYLLSLRW